MSAEKAPSRHWSRRAVAFAAVVIVVDLGGARVLASLGILDRLLASDAPLTLGVLPLAAVFFVARLCSRFLAPGLLAAALLLGWLWPPRRG